MSTTASSESAFSKFVSSFSDLMRLPRAFWLVIGAFVIDAMAYFGVLTLMTTYLSSDLGWGDTKAGITVSIFTMIVTLLMLGVGSYAEGFGLRKAISAALALAFLGRIFYSWAPQMGGGILVAMVVLAAILVVATGEAILQPVCYSGIKQYTDAKTSSMGYGLIYAFMNLGIVGVGALSSWLRPAVEDFKSGKTVAPGAGHTVEFFSSFSATGVQAVNWACAILTGLTLVWFAVSMTRKVAANKLRPDDAEAQHKGPKLPLARRLREFFTGGPFSNPRFIFFIFMLLPIRTLFAHQWLTMPQYIMRAYDKDVADRMELLVNWINPGIIFIGVPVATALTRHVNVYTMMIIGSLVSAVPTFLLCSGPNLTLLITYFVIFSIGEALWSARFLEYASELAPPGRIAQYMGLANVPWLLAKGTTGFYSGWMLSKYCPQGTAPADMHTGTMWFIYGCVAMLSPIGLWMARRWAMAGVKTSY